MNLATIYFLEQFREDIGKFKQVARQIITSATESGHPSDIKFISDMRRELNDIGCEVLIVIETKSSAFQVNMNPASLIQKEIPTIFNYIIESYGKTFKLKNFEVIVKYVDMEYKTNGMGIIGGPVDMCMPAAIERAYNLFGLTTHIK